MMKPVLSLVCLDLAWLRAAQSCKLFYEAVFFVLINFKFTKCFLDNSYALRSYLTLIKGVSHLESVLIILHIQEKVVKI